ncbi:hypothetical protein HK098_000695 [Nowakowskiella sp. JEL0407]|nr:hypothetical protein HK098_000695 [Nowakowskiella sp. JEL0407]
MAKSEFKQKLCNFFLGKELNFLDQNTTDFISLQSSCLNVRFLPDPFITSPSLLASIFKNEESAAQFWSGVFELFKEANGETEPNLSDCFDGSFLQKFEVSETNLESYLLLFLHSFSYISETFQNDEYLSKLQNLVKIITNKRSRYLNTKSLLGSDLWSEVFLNKNVRVYRYIYRSSRHHINQNVSLIELLEEIRFEKLYHTHVVSRPPQIFSLLSASLPESLSSIPRNKPLSQNTQVLVNTLATCLQTAIEFSKISDYILVNNLYALGSYSMDLPLSWFIPEFVDVLVDFLKLKFKRRGENIAEVIDGSDAVVLVGLETCLKLLESAVRKDESTGTLHIPHPNTNLQTNVSIHYNLFSNLVANARVKNNWVRLTVEEPWVRWLCDRISDSEGKHSDYANAGFLKGLTVSYAKVDGRLFQGYVAEGLKKLIKRAGCDKFACALAVSAVGGILFDRDIRGLWVQNGKTNAMVLLNDVLSVFYENVLAIEEAEWNKVVDEVKNQNLNKSSLKSDILPNANNPKETQTISILYTNAGSGAKGVSSIISDIWDNCENEDDFMVEVSKRIKFTSETVNRQWLNLHSINKHFERDQPIISESLLKFFQTQLLFTTLLSNRIALLLLENETKMKVSSVVTSNLLTAFSLLHFVTRNFGGFKVWHETLVSLVKAGPKMIEQDFVRLWIESHLDPTRTIFFIKLASLTLEYLPEKFISEFIVKITIPFLTSTDTQVNTELFETSHELVLSIFEQRRLIFSDVVKKLVLEYASILNYPNKIDFETLRNGFMCLSESASVFSYESNVRTGASRRKTGLHGSTAQKIHVVSENFSEFIDEGMDEGDDEVEGDELRQSEGFDVNNGDGLKLVRDCVQLLVSRINTISDDIELQTPHSDKTKDVYDGRHVMEGFVKKPTSLNRFKEIESSREGINATTLATSLFQYQNLIIVLVDFIKTVPLSYLSELLETIEMFVMKPWLTSTVLKKVMEAAFDLVASETVLEVEKKNKSVIWYLRLGKTIDERERKATVDKSLMEVPADGDIQLTNLKAKL